MTYYFLKNYNNYFNRIVKKHDNIEDYLEEVKTYETYTDNDISFNPRDYINAGISHLSWLATLTWKPNYMIEVNDSKQIVRRWFVTNFNFVSNTELYNVELRRDVLVDYNDSIMNSPCFVQKGHLTPINSLFYNKENFEGEQIPQEDYEICDESYCSWMVIYYDKSKKSKLKSDTIGTIKLDYINALPLDYATIADWPIYQSFGGNNSYDKISPNSIRQFVVEWLYHDSFAAGNSAYNQYYLMRSRFRWGTDRKIDEYAHLYEDQAPLNNHFFLGAHLYTTYAQESAITKVRKLVVSSITSAVNADLDNWDGPGPESGISFAELMNWDNKIVKTNDNKYYRIHVAQTATGVTTTKYQPPLWLASYKNAINNSSDSDINSGYNALDARCNIFYIAGCDQYKVSYQEISGASLEFDFDFTRARVDDTVPYGCIAIPYKNLRYLNNYDYTLRAAPALAALLMSSSEVTIHDIQILPFCPLLGVWHDNEDALQIDAADYGYKSSDTADPAELYDYTWIKRHGTATKNLPVLFPHDVNLMKSIEYYPPQVASITQESDKKLANQCEFFRLSSPSWDTMFDFVPCRGADLYHYTIKQTLKPYQPYVQVCPEFNKLYGVTLNDARGIVCTNNFSYTQISNAWNEYKMQNMNYQAAFDRQIQSMDTKYDINRALSVDNAQRQAKQGFLGAGVGLVGSLMTGNALGAGASLLAGMRVENTAITAQRTIAAQDQLHAEDRQYAIDMHNYDLQNIKARPDTITKIDNFNPTNRTFPILTRYMCSTESKAAFLDKIRYEGMTINCVGSLLSYTDEENLTFVKGQLIRLENFDEDAHMANYIAGEVAQGFYC